MPSLFDRGEAVGDHLPRLNLAHLPPVRIASVSATPCDARPCEIAHAPGLMNGPVSGLNILLPPRADERGDYFVHPVEQDAAGTAVERENGEQSTTPLDRLSRLRVDRHVGSPEAVDRLLGVADKKQAPRFRGSAVPVGREGQRDLNLERVGVLELVDEHYLVPGTQASRGFTIALQ